ncbi:MAG: nucleoside 2-deoxyribosyltransferase [Acidimicrobiales bacterium]
MERANREDPGSSVVADGAGPLVYVAGPLFDEGERWWIETVDRTVVDCGFSTFLPHRDNPDKTADNTGEIFRNDRDAIDRCALLVANLNGLTTDDGTAWELGYSHALGKYQIGLHTDWRSRFPNEVVNLMIEESLHVLVHSLDDLADALRGWRSANGD